MLRISLRTLFAAVIVLPLLAGLDGCRKEPDSGAAPAKLRRLTEAQYRRSIADVFGEDVSVVGRFEPDLRVEGLLAVGTGRVSITLGGMEQYESIAREIARQVVDPANRERRVGCGPTPADAQGKACAGQFLQRVGARLFRRPLTAEEVQQAVANAQEGMAKLGDFDAGLAAALTGLLTAPDFLFRIDRPGPQASTLDAWSKASRLSFFLWNASPDEALLDAARRGELDTEAGLERQVDRMLASPRFVDGVRAFLDDFLQLDGLDTLSKDALLFPAFSPAVAVDAREQTLRTLVDLLVTRQGDYRDIFTDRHLAMNRRLGPIYDLPVPSQDWSMQEFPASDPRAGLLSQASFLALHSHPGRSSPTLRGKAVREILMCEKIPTPPANVNFTIVQDVSNPDLKTTRARVEAHLSDGECASCHRLTDPIGLALEQFDGLGQFRRQENGVAIDPAGKLDENAFADAASLGQVLHQHPAVVSCLVQQVWHYASGQSGDRRERAFLRYLEQRFADGDYRLPALMRVIATSRSFYTVTPDTATAAVATPRKS